MITIAILHNKTYHHNEHDYEDRDSDDVAVVVFLYLRVSFIVAVGAATDAASCLCN